MKHSIKITRDNDYSNPRKDDDGIMGTMLCFHNRYQLGDIQEKNSGASSWDENFLLHLKHKFELPEGMTFEGLETWTRKNIIYLPLYLYDHSGITIATTPFSCRWDSGQVGFIYVSKERVRELRGIKRISTQVIKSVIEELEGEVKLYDAYLRGQVYQYEVIDEEGDTVDSLCGIYYVDNDADFINQIVEHVTYGEYFDTTELYDVVMKAFHDRD